MVGGDLPYVHMVGGDLPYVHMVCDDLASVHIIGVIMWLRNIDRERK